jgi:hypothetical protein
MAGPGAGPPAARARPGGCSVRSPALRAPDLFSMAETREAVAVWQAERLASIRADRLIPKRRLERQARTAARHVSAGGESIRWLLRSDMRDVEWNTPAAAIRSLRRAQRAARVLEVVVARIGALRATAATEAA